MKNTCCVHPLLQSKTRYSNPSPNYLMQCQGIGYSDSFQPAQMTFLPVVCFIANYLCCLSLVCSFHLTLSDAQTVNNASFMLLQPVLLTVCLLGRHCMSEQPGIRTLYMVQITDRRISLEGGEQRAHNREPGWARYDFSSYIMTL